MDLETLRGIAELMEEHGLTRSNLDASYSLKARHRPRGGRPGPRGRGAGARRLAGPLGPRHDARPHRCLRGSPGTCPRAPHGRT